MSFSDTAEAFEVLRTALQDDEAFAYGWHANLAMAYFDCMPQHSDFWFPNGEPQMKLANAAATVFMKRCFDVETSQDMLLKEEK